MHNAIIIRNEQSSGPTARIVGRQSKKEEEGFFQSCSNARIVNFHVFDISLMFQNMIIKVMNKSKKSCYCETRFFFVFINI